MHTEKCFELILSISILFLLHIHGLLQVKVKTVNPLYQSKFLFFVRHPEGQELKFEAIDEGTRRVLGSFTMSVNRLMQEPLLEYNQQTFMLTLGVHQSPMVLTVRLRVSFPTFLSFLPHVAIEQSVGELPDYNSDFLKEN